MSKQKKLVVGVVAFLVLLLAVVSLGFYVPPWSGKGSGDFAIGCGDSVSCNRADWVIRVINTGTGHGIFGKTKSTSADKAAVFGQATSSASGVYGTSVNGVGGRFKSTNAVGVYVNDAGKHGVYVNSAGSDGVHVSGAVNNGVFVNSAGGYGVCVNDADDGVHITNAVDYGIYVGSAGNDGVYVNAATYNGVYVKNALGDGVNVAYAGGAGVDIDNCSGNGILVNNAGIWGGYFKGTTGGVKAISASGNLIEAWNSSARKFKVTNDGHVYSDVGFNTPAADFAEMLPAVGVLEPGDVLVIGVDGKLTRSSNAYSTAVAGVYSTKPGFVGGAGDDEDLTGQVPLAVVGVVPVKASAENGSISPGDLLTTSNTAGHAMKATEPRLGTIIGKALESLESGTGTIRMLVTLQ